MRPSANGWPRVAKSLEIVHGHGIQNPVALRGRRCSRPCRWLQVCLRGLVSGSQQGYDGPPVRRVVAGSACWIVRVRSPKLRIEGGLRIAEFHVPVSPKDIDAVWILAAFMG